MSFLPRSAHRSASVADTLTRSAAAAAGTAARVPGAGLARLYSMTMLACLSGALMVLAAGPARAEDAPLPTVNAVDLARYAGSWYEISKLPNRFQKQCVADTQAEYRLDGDIVRVINRCRTSTGELDDIKGRAKVVPGSGNAKLKVTFFWPFYGDYWVLALDPDYREVLVGAPDRKYAWILSRTPTLPQERVDALLQRAQALGFDAAAFVPTPQTQPLPAVAPAGAAPASGPSAQRGAPTQPVAMTTTALTPRPAPPAR